MQKINHHPSDESLLRYASGGYDAAYNLTMATHVGICKQCQKAVHLHQSVGGHVLEAQKPAEMRLSAEAVLDLAETTPTPKPAPRKAGYSQKFGFEVPPLLNEYLCDDFDDLKWQRLSPNIRQHVIDVEGKASARLLWMNPGHGAPAHGHTGEELTMVLTGGYFDGDEPYTKGDMQCVDHEAPHMPTAMMDAPCIVLAATDSPLVFKNLIPRLLQPLFKI